MSFLFSSGLRIAIPDENIYLQDDWGDNKLQNRDGSGTTTYNGVEGVYRPEWTIDWGTPEAANQRLQMDQGELIYTEINLDLSQTITWSWTDLDLSNQNGSSNAQFEMGCFAQTATRNRFTLDECYAVQIDRNAGYIDLRRHGVDDDFGSTIISGSHPGGTAGNSITVTRASNGDWELLVNSASQGTTNDTTYTTVSNTHFGYRDGSTGTISLNEIKVN